MISDFKAYIIGDREYFQWRDEDQQDTIKKDFALAQSLLDFLDLDFAGEPEHIYFTVGLPLPEAAWMWQNQIRLLISEALGAHDDVPVQRRLAAFFFNPARQGMDWFKFEPIPTRFERLNENTFTEVLYPETTYDLVNFFLREIVRREITFKTCRCCGRYFPSYVHGNAEYCERVFQDGKTCKEIGAVSMFRARLEESPAMQLYQRAYKTRFARIKAKRMTREAFAVWGEQARVYRDKVMAGEMALEKFERWIKEN